MCNGVNDIPTSTRLREIFTYVDGELIRNSTGERAGTPNGSGYISVVVDGKRD